MKVCFPYLASLIAAEEKDADLVAEEKHAERDNAILLSKRTEHPIEPREQRCESMQIDDSPLPPAPLPDVKVEQKEEEVVNIDRRSALANPWIGKEFSV